MTLIKCPHCGGAAVTVYWRRVPLAIAFIFVAKYVLDWAFGR